MANLEYKSLCWREEQWKLYNNIVIYVENPVGYGVKLKTAVGANNLCLIEKNNYAF